jgi:hypothetical protein
MTKIEIFAQFFTQFFTNLLQLDRVEGREVAKKVWPATADDSDDWAFDFRRCGAEGCHGVMDDDLVVPRCCACGLEVPDGPGSATKAAPSGRRFQGCLQEQFVPE